MFEAAPSSDSFGAMVTSSALNQATVNPVTVSDQDRRRKVAIKCLELEGMLESQGYSPKEIETKVASFRALLMRPAISNPTPENNNGNGIRKEVAVIKDDSPERKRDSSSCSDRRSRRKKKRKKDHKRRKKDRKHRRRSSESESDLRDDPAAKSPAPALQGKDPTADPCDTKNDEGRNEKEKRKKRKKRTHSRSQSRSTSRGRARRSRSSDKKRKKKKKRRSPRSPSVESIEVVAEEEEAEVKPPNKDAMPPRVDLEIEAKTEATEDDETPKKAIVFSRIEDIPTLSSPARASSPDWSPQPPKLSFEIAPAKKHPLTNPLLDKPTSPLGKKVSPLPTLAPKSPPIIFGPKEEPPKPEVEADVEPEVLPRDENEQTAKEEPKAEPKILKFPKFLPRLNNNQVKSNNSPELEEEDPKRKSRSRSRSYDRSRSRSRSSSYSRSRSSRSRSYSYSSRSRSRSPSIPRRRGSPSFLDRRRITSARKRPIPYHRPTPSASSESSYGSSYQRSRSRSISSTRSSRSRSFSP